MHPSAKRKRHWAERRPDAVAAAIKCFKSAICSELIEAKRAYPAAYVALADCYTFLYVIGGRHGELHAEAVGAASAAVLDDTEYADAHAALGAVKAIFERNWSEAEREFRRALELQPDCLNAHGWYSGHLSCLGRTEDAVTHSDRAMAIDPLSLFTAVHAAKVRYFCRRYSECLALLESLAAGHPNHPLVSEFRGMAYAATGELKLAETNLKPASEVSQKHVTVEASLGNVYARRGKTALAERIIHELETKSRISYVPQSQIAQVWVGLRHFDRALRCLDRAFEEQDFFLSILCGWAVFDPIRKHPKFRDLLRKLNLPSTGDTVRYVTSQ